MPITGKLMYGQSGSYDAEDDRLALSVAMQGTPGLWRPPWLQAGSGLDVILRDGFAAGVDCGDGTLAVAAKRGDLTVPCNAGSTSGARSDEIWLSVNPNEATWEIGVYPWQQCWGGQIGTGLGLSLGSLQIPAGANLASQFNLVRSLSSMGSIRNYRNADERHYFEAQNPYRAWGSMTGLDNAQGIDMLWGNHWWRIFQGNDIPLILSGYYELVTNGSGQAWFLYPMPPDHPQYTNLPTVFFSPYMAYVNTVVPLEVQTGATRIGAYNANGQPMGGVLIRFMYLIRGRMDSGAI